MENTNYNPEQYASDALNLDGDFRKVKKTNLISFFSDLTKMPTETARHAIEQFPIAIGNATTSVKSLFDRIPALLDSNTKTHESMMNMLSADDMHCWARINDPSVDDAEREKCYQKLEANKNHALAECADDRKFKINLFDHSGTILLLSLGACLAILGVNGKVPIPNVKK